MRISVNRNPYALIGLLFLLFHQLGFAGVRPDFTLPDLDDHVHRLSDYRGQWVLVNYWATWCPPCLEELPELEMFHSESAGKAVVLGINMEDIGKEALKAFVDGQFLSFPILRANTLLPADQRLGDIPGLPTSYLVSPQGEAVARQVGPVTLEAIRQFIDHYEGG